MKTASIRSILSASDFNLLTILASQYVSTQKLFLEAAEAMKSDEMIRLVNDCTTIEENIMTLLPTAVRILKVDMGAAISNYHYVLAQYGKDNFVHLKPINDPKTVAKFEMHIVNKIADATLFTDEAKAQEQLVPANYAAFRNFIAEFKAGNI